MLLIRNGTQVCFRHTKLSALAEVSVEQVPATLMSSKPASRVCLDSPRVWFPRCKHLQASRKHAWASRAKRRVAHSYPKEKADRASFFATHWPCHSLRTISTHTLCCISRRRWILSPGSARTWPRPAVLNWKAQHPQRHLFGTILADCRLSR